MQRVIQKFFNGTAYVKVENINVLEEGVKNNSMVASVRNKMNISTRTNTLNITLTRILSQR